MKQNGIEESYFKRIKKKVYGDYIIEYNSVADIARMFMADYFKGINSFDYIEKYDEITLEYVNEVLNNLFKEENMVMSVVKSK